MQDKNVKLHGQDRDYDACVNLMNDDIREALYTELAPCTDQVFLDAYCLAHYKKYGEDFVI